jgi:putative transposase
LEECRWLWNTLLAERQQAWDERQESLSYFDQQHALPSLKDPLLKTVHSQVAQQVANRFDLAFAAYSRRVKAGQTPGYPRSRGIGRYDSLTYPQCKLDATSRRLMPFKIGDFKIIYLRLEARAPANAQRKHQLALDAHKTKRDEVMEQVHHDYPALDDQGVWQRANQDVNARAAGQHRQRRRKSVARTHKRVRWKRDGFTHQHRRRIVTQFALSALEDLAVSQMAQNGHLAKSIHAVAWTQFREVIAWKAACAARRRIAVNPLVYHQRLLRLWRSENGPDVGRPHLPVSLLWIGHRPRSERGAA